MRILLVFILAVALLSGCGSPKDPAPTYKLKGVKVVKVEVRFRAADVITFEGANKNQFRLWNGDGDSDLLIIGGKYDITYSDHSIKTIEPTLGGQVDGRSH